MGVMFQFLKDLPITTSSFDAHIPAKQLFRKIISVGTKIFLPRLYSLLKLLHHYGRCASLMDLNKNTMPKMERKEKEQMPNTRQDSNPCSL